jgi:hypothetical protein
MPREVFVAGEILDAAELNVISDQSVMVFASESARNTAIPFPTEGMVVYLEDSNNIRVYTGSSWEQMQISASDISSGTLPIGRGGTGATSLTASGYLKGNGTSAITSQSGIPAGDITSGTLPIDRGGTGATTLSSGGYLKGNGTSAITSQSGIPAGDITSGSLAIARGGTGFTDAILPRRTLAGSGTVGTDGYATVTFPSGRFTTAPFVVINRVGGDGGTSYEAPLIVSVTSSELRLYINNANNPFQFIAMQND